MSSSSAGSRAAHVRDDLRARIASGEWELHSRLPGETTVAEEYAVGRGTVREAIGALVSLGLLESAAGRGTFVRSRVPTDTVLVSLMRGHGPEECLQLRAAIEGEAARVLAARRDVSAFARRGSSPNAGAAPERMPGEFHTRLVEAGSAPLAVSLHAALMQAIRQFTLTGELRFAVEDAARDQEHSTIIDAITSGDTARAAELAAEHARTDLSAG